MKHLLNQKGSTGIIVTAVSIMIILLISTVAIVYFTIKDQHIEFPADVVADATKVAEDELTKAFAATENFPFEKRFEAIQSIGYQEPEEGEYAIFTFEKKYDQDSNYYIILKLKPHEQYRNLSRVNISVFDKETGAVIVEKENVLTWKTEKDLSNS